MDINFCLAPLVNNPECVINEHHLDRYKKLIITGSSKSFTGYTETHHILPRSLEGPDEPENLISLSARYHFLAHYILAKACSHPKMIKALHMMVHSTTGVVKRDYRISSRVYEYLRTAHVKVVSAYSKKTVVARNKESGEVRRIPSDVFHNNKHLYEAMAVGRKDSPETRRKKQIASQRPRKKKVYSKKAAIAATKWQYSTPRGYAETFVDLQVLYPSFTKNSQAILKDEHIITNKFVSIHKDFAGHVGKTLAEVWVQKD